MKAPFPREGSLKSAWAFFEISTGIVYWFEWVVAKVFWLNARG